MERLATVCITTNEDPKYYRCWPLTALAWNRWFPETEVVLGFLTHKKRNDPLVEKMERFGTVELFTPQKGIPTPNQALILRQYLAASRGDGLHMIHDVDSIMMQRQFIEERVLSQVRPRDHLLAVGRDVLRQRCIKFNFPMGYTTGTSAQWERISGTKGLTWGQFALAQRGVKAHDGKGDVNLPAARTGHVKYFSNESWFAAKLARAKCLAKIHHVDARDRWPDILTIRQTFDWEKMKMGGYIGIHHHLPIEEYVDRLTAIAKHLGVTEDWQCL